MQAVVVCVVLCAVTGVLNASPFVFPMQQAPKPCCQPDQLTMEMGQSVAYVAHDHPGLSQLAGKVFMDYTNKMMATHVVQYTEGRAANMTIISDFNNRVMYLIDDDKRECVKGKLPTAEMSAQCLPDHAKYMGTVKFGMGTTLSGDSWAWQIKDKESKIDVMVFVTMSSDSCVPINEAFQGHMEEVELFAGMSYFNIKDSIDDPSVFNIPDFCKKDSVQFSEQLLTNPLQNFLVRKQCLN